MKTSDLIENSILLVANGRSVLEHEIGAEIDRFETVGRINNYETTGFERFVGSRTDIWFNGANQKLKQREDLPPRIVVLIPEDILKRKGEPCLPAPEGSGTGRGLLRRNVGSFCFCG